MNNFIFLFKIIIYILLALLPFLFTFYVRTRATISSRKTYQIKNKIGKCGIFFCSLLFGWYSTICSKIPYTSDRGNYVLRFVNYVEDPWTVGLNFVADIIHLFTNNPNVLFFTITFFCVFLTLWAYRLSNAGNRETLLLWAFSMSIIHSFYLLKQGPAMALGAVSIVFFMKRKYGASAVFFILSVLFHESALILIPIFVAMRLSRKQWRRWIIYSMITMSVIFFSSVSRYAIQFFGTINSDVFGQITTYLDDTGAIAFSLNLATALKGIPYYLITLYGFMKRKDLKDKINNYDEYLILSTATSGLYLLSSYMYWMWRFGAYGFFPMYLFASEMYRKQNNRKSAQMFFFTIWGFLTFFTLRYLYQIYFKYGGF